MDRDVKGIFIGVMLVAVLLSPIGVAVFNHIEYANQKMDDSTSYHTKKEVEDTCRSYIVSYESDKLTYEMYKDTTDSEEKKWSNSAKIRANKTAVTYNEYILKNSFVFDGNIPSDIKARLEVLE